MRKINLKCGLGKMESQHIQLGLLFEERIIFKRLEIENPVHLPDLIASNFSQWDYLKERMYVDKPELTQNITVTNVDNCIVKSARKNKKV